MNALDMYLYRISVIINFCFFIGILYKVYFRVDDKKRKQISLGITVYLIIAEIGRLIWFKEHNILTYDLLPLHLCSYSIFMIIFEEFRKTKFIKTFVILCGAPCAVSALIVPINSDSPLQIINLQSIISHLSIILMGFIWLGENYVPEKSDNRNNRIIFIVLLTISSVINYFWGTNFMYINYPIFEVPMSLWTYRIALFAIYMSVSDIMSFVIFRREARLNRTLQVTEEA